MDDDDDRGTLRTVATPRQRPRRRRPGRVKLRVQSGPKAGAEFSVDQNRVRVGRSRAADVVVDDESVSAQHFDLRLTPWGIELVDLGSTNGTRVFGRQVGRMFVEAGDTVVAGSCEIKLMGVDEIDVDQHDELREDGLLGGSPVMAELYATIDKVAKTDLSVLVTGETGTGKELVARALHRRSARRDKPFVVLDCAGLTSTLAESTLYGYVRGAFTGANEDRAGVFEQASGGTLFLDEVGELPLALQAKLLGVLSRGEVVRIGEHRRRKVDVRVVAATLRDVRRMVDGGAFREDLYFRLAHASLEIPPLRERDDDMVQLAREYLDRIVEQDGVARMLDTSTVAELRRYPWPGNVRELVNVISRAAALCEDGVIWPDDLGLVTLGPESKGIRLDELLQSGTYVDIHDKLDRMLLPRVVGSAGSLRKAADALKIGRKKLTTRLQELGLLD